MKKETTNLKGKYEINLRKGDEVKQIIVKTIESPCSNMLLYVVLSKTFNASEKCFIQKVFVFKKLINM